MERDRREAGMGPGLRMREAFPEEMRSEQGFCRWNTAKQGKGASCSSEAGNVGHHSGVECEHQTAGEAEVSQGGHVPTMRKVGLSSK